VDVAASPARGFAYALVAAVVGAIGMTVLGGVLAISAGLLVVAAVTGWAIGVGLRTGGGPRLDPSDRVRIALILVTLAVAAAQVSLWLYARSEGGVLGPIDYLVETFGFLVPLELLAGWIAAWATAR
jgi:hypothetical protein